jgi:hypothetical protein
VVLIQNTANYAQKIIAALLLQRKNCQKMVKIAKNNQNMDPGLLTICSRSSSSLHFESRRFYFVQVVLCDVVDDLSRHQEPDGVPSPDRQPDAGRADHVGHPLRHDMNVVLEVIFMDKFLPEYFAEISQNRKKSISARQTYENEISAENIPAETDPVHISQKGSRITEIIFQS